MAAAHGLDDGYFGWRATRVFVAGLFHLLAARTLARDFEAAKA